MRRIKFNLVLSFIVLCVCGFGSSSIYAEQNSSDSFSYSTLLASSEKKSVYNTSRGDGLSSLNTSYYDGLTGGFYFDGELSIGYLLGFKPNVFMNFGLIYPFDLDSDEFGLGFTGGAAYSFGFTSFYELQAGGGLILWYASSDVKDNSLFRIYLAPRVSNVFHVTDNLAFYADALFSLKLFSSRDHSYVKRPALDLGGGIIYKF